MSYVQWCASGGRVFVTVWVSVYRLRKIGETMCIDMHIHIYTQGLQVDILPCLGMCPLAKRTLNKGSQFGRNGFSAMPAYRELQFVEHLGGVLS